MPRKIKLSIRARGETDSPTVDDLLDQIKDYFEILEGVERAIAEDGTNAIVWRVVGATTNSPIAIEAQAFSRDFAVSIDDRAEIVTRETANGLLQLETTGERPAYFNDKVLLRAERIFERVTNGLETTDVDYGPGLPAMKITPRIARNAVENTRKILSPEQRPYDELGSIEGYADSIGRDGWGKRLLFVHHRLTGETIKCIVSGEALEELETHQIRDVWRGRRVQVFGRLHYKGLGILASVDVLQVRFLRDRSELPDVDDIQDENFTKGQRTEDYLARLRDGKPS